MKILTIWVWAFWLAILKYLSINHKDKTFYAYENNKESLLFMQKNRKNPYFFIDDKIEKNIKLLDEIEKILPSIDLIIIAIPNQFIKNLIKDIKPFLKPKVSFLNLSKWVDNKNLKTVSDNLNEELWGFEYNYNILSGWMIASELFYGKNLWAQIWYSNKISAILLKNLFESENLKIKLTKDFKNIELFWAFKNILALYTWYLEWMWYEYSSIWYHFCELFKDIKKLVIDLWWKDNFDFSQYALWWDIIATCFWNSRNRYFGKLVWNWKTSKEAFEILKNENKHAEWFETLKWIKKFIKDKNWYYELKKVIKIFLD